ncbi:MAG: hypothetical protein P8H03_00150 [Emcibacteraceae bacterium]|nr:hypothetical protein [Emcibacteraceae bacterium]MDG1859497.1 hypothetical protein [Emcibacteraceae bacterium]
MSPEMKSYIEELKSKGDFRPEGLRGYYLGMIGILILTFMFALFPFSILVKTEVISKSFETFIILFGIFIIISMMFYLFFYFPWRLYNSGEYIEGKIVKAQHSSIPFLLGFGWTIRATFIVCGKEYDANQDIKSFKNKHFVGFDLPLEGDKILIFYNKYFPNKNKIFVSGFFSDNCLSKSRYKKVMDFLNRDQ